VEEKWIEPAREIQYPFSLLYHQTMSTLAALGELTPSAIAQNILTLPPFKSITQDDFRLFLRHLIEIDHLEKTPVGGLIIGISAERMIGNFKFYAIFPDTEEYLVKHDGKAVGSIIVPPMEGDRFSLAGKTWEVTEVNAKKKTIAVKPSKKSVTSSSWRGTTGEIHTKVLQRMKRVLQEETIYPYLQPGAKQRLQEARELAQARGFLYQPIQFMEDDFCCILPWMGTVSFRTLERFLRFYAKDALGLKSMKVRSPYFMIVRMGKCSIEALGQEIRSLSDRTISADMLLADDEIPKLQKFDPYIPPELLRQSFMTDYLDLRELASIIETW
jgi:ATP-dependent helicase Lhr and Lhr-like helicase